MERNIILSSGLMEGVEGSPPSKPMISESISSVVNLKIDHLVQQFLGEVVVIYAAFSLHDVNNGEILLEI